MAPSLSLRGLMVVICSLAVLSLAQTLDTLYVKPTSDTPCDQDPCLTLMEYADNASQYFARDTEAVFLSGQHLLEINILINNTVTFIMHKGINASPEIVCTAAVGIVFFNVAFVSITELSFISCGTVTTDVTNQKWALTSYSVGLFVMANATVRMSHGSAVYTFNTTFHSLGNHIQDNTAGIEGGGMLAVSSNVSIENCYFYNNSATGFAGGAVSVYNSLIVFSGVNIFADNKAENGGGVFLSYSNVLFEGSNTFIHNSANRNGGAIFSQYSIIKFSGNTTFKSNSAISSTSALYVACSEFIIFTGATTFTGNGPSMETLFFDNCTAAIEGTLTFEYNQGGLTVQGSSNINIRGIAKFLNNSATIIDSSALSVFDSRVTFSGTTIFAGNSPVKGCKFGAVYVGSSTVQFMGHTTFTDNKADTGSVVYAKQASVQFVGTQSFERNAASEQGGAIYMFNSTVNVTGCSSFINNSAGVYGGAIANRNGQLYITGNATFIGNQAPLGGGLYFEYNSQLFLISPLELSFQHNSAERGGAIYAIQASVEFIGTQSFKHNVASEEGGAILIFYSMVNITGCSSFINNSAGEYGGAIANGNGQLYITGNAIFIGNKAPLGGGLYFEYNSQLFLASPLELSFQYNSAERGGAIYTIQANIEFVGTQSFEHNVASKGGGAILIFYSMVNITGCCSFINNSAGVHGGAIANVNGQLYITGNATFIGNKAHLGGGLYFQYTSQFLTSPLELSFQYNSAENGGAIYVQQANIEFVGTQSFVHNVASGGGGAILMFNFMVNITGSSSFINNSADVFGGAIANRNGQLYITGNATFIGNHAPFGGGLCFQYISQLFLTSPLELSFQYNSAQKGGAIYVNDETNSINCFSDPMVTVFSHCFVIFLSSDVKLDFVGNVATDKGQNVFGGMLDRCTANDKLFSSKLGLSLLMKTINASTISSEPLRLCFCVNGQINYTYDPPPFSIVRGATISVSAVALDQVNYTVTATIRSYYRYNNGTVSDFGLGQGAQQIGATCTTLNYTILTTASLVRFILYPEGPCRDTLKFQRQISVHLLPCPITFELSGVQAQCICEQRLQPFTNSCNVESQTFSRSKNFWVGTECRDGNYSGLILHPHCPLDYCISNYPAEISVNDLNSQCSFNRCGILCGSCKQNLSLALGSSQCLLCSNYYLALLIPFAVAGVALVFVLFMLRLTLSIGTLSGLIFYANIVAVNKEIFFPPQTTNILTVFIAWMNLDLGIETCFFTGMDTYARTWLQYVFPFYIWLLVSIIIVVSHYSVRVPKLLGRNPIAVLATLFLLSYAKLLRTIIASFSATVLDYPGNSTDTVWLYDGNNSILKRKTHSSFSLLTCCSPLSLPPLHSPSPLKPVAASPL